MHEIRYLSYDAKLSRKEIEDAANRIAEESSDDRCGLYHSIRWIDKVCDSYYAAKEVIESNDRGAYDQLAVKYYANSHFTDAKRKQLEEKLSETYKELQEIMTASYPKTLASSFIGCKECGSRLSTKHLKGNFCPVCGNDLRPEYIQKKIVAARNRWKSAEGKLRDYIDKHSKKTIKWFVKIEYHT